MLETDSYLISVDKINKMFSDLLTAVLTYNTLSLVDNSAVFVLVSVLIYTNTPKLQRLTTECVSSFIRGFLSMIGFYTVNTFHRAVNLDSGFNLQYMSNSLINWGQSLGLRFTSIHLVRKGERGKQTIKLRGAQPKTVQLCNNKVVVSNTMQLAPCKAEVLNASICNNFYVVICCNFKQYHMQQMLFVAIAAS